MTPTKTYADLLRMILNEYKEGSIDVYPAHSNIYDSCEVVRIELPDCPSWATPALVLKQWGTNTHHVDLYINAIAPTKGYNETIDADWFLFSSAFEGTNLLFAASARRFLGTAALQLTNEDAVLNNFTFEVIGRVQQLVSSGVYGMDPLLIQQKQTAQ